MSSVFLPNPISYYSPTAEARVSRYGKVSVLLSGLVMLWPVGMVIADRLIYTLMQHPASVNSFQRLVTVLIVGGAMSLAALSLSGLILGVLGVYASRQTCRFALGGVIFNLLLMLGVLLSHMAGKL